MKLWLSFYLRENLKIKSRAEFWFKLNTLGLALYSLRPPRTLEGISRRKIETLN